ncbi:Methylmalonic aciduria and homocystinuria type D -like protein, mitochondrial [Trichinella nelsoni]|uniref:Methylmalonic aciduria and homocystinuria type D-like protein, mitochondrial n=1 Tax=Trichinella nelsoni TaxID=6336 RepID=A0A0V0SLA3_9BILA|nr:Methylmalonic aciduria and homocystinuria type D -like protein, mitochondrial [Trichinella nelsoni]
MSLQNVKSGNRSVFSSAVVAVNNVLKEQPLSALTFRATSAPYLNSQQANQLPERVNTLSNFRLLPNVGCQTFPAYGRIDGSGKNMRYTASIDNNLMCAFAGTPPMPKKRPNKYQLMLKNFDTSIVPCPLLVRRELRDLFPTVDVMNRTMTALCLSKKTLNDMVVWSAEGEAERENINEDFINVAKDIVCTIRDHGYWADFIDPFSGKPFYSGYTNATLFETDERYSLLGFTVEDMVCCKVIKHPKFGSNVVVGTVFTNAPEYSAIIKEFSEAIKKN